MGTCAKKGVLENARLRLLGTAVHRGVFAYLFSVFFHSHHVPTAHQLVVTLVNSFSLAPNEIIANPESTSSGTFDGRIMQAGRCGAWVLWSTPALLRSTLRPSWWKMEKGLWRSMETSRRAHQRVGTSSSHQWGPLVFTVHSKHSFQRGLSNGLNGDFGSFGKRAFRIAAPLVMKFNSLTVAASFTPLLVYCPTDLNPADGPTAKGHQHGALGKVCKKRLRATIGLLRDRLIAPRTLTKHRTSTAGFFNFCSMAGYPKTHTATEMDLRLCEFVQHAWEEGDSCDTPADARSDLMHFIDAPLGHLHGSQRLLLA